MWGFSFKVQHAYPQPPPAPPPKKTPGRADAAFMGQDNSTQERVLIQGMGSAKLGAIHFLEVIKLMFSNTKGGDGCSKGVRNCTQN